MDNPLLRWVTGRQPERALSLTLDDWASFFTYNGSQYPLTGLNQTLAGQKTEPYWDDNTFAGMVQGGYKSNGIIFACIQARFMLLSQARFQFQQMRSGQPGDLFGTADLNLLEHPEPGQVTADLLARASVDVDLAGNHYLAKRSIDGQPRLKRMRPDWVTIVMGSRKDPEVDAWDVDCEVIGYLYHPGGRHSGREPEVLPRNEVAHLAPVKDPLASYRGMSWLTSIVPEIKADSSATTHKLKFFENGATPNMVVSLDIDVPEKFQAWVDKMDETHKGVVNAYKTLYLGAGSKAEVVGSNMQQIDFRVTQGAGEVRIATAAGMHPVILGLSEGLSGSSLNQGNFMAARRLVADMTLRPWWGNFAASLEVIMPPPAGSELWYDERHIPFLAEDVKDAAEVQNLNAMAIRQLVDGGFVPASVVDAIVSGDLKRLTHTNLYSVQLQPPGTVAPPTPPVPAQVGSNGNGRELLLALATREQPAPQINITTPPTVIEKGAVQVPITFPEGFVRSETPVNVTTPPTIIEKGALQLNAPITVERTELTIEEGAIRSETPVTVHTPDVTIEEGAVRVDSPITVEQPDITVSPAEVRIEQPKARTVVKDVTHDAKGRITRVKETEE